MISTSHLTGSLLRTYTTIFQHPLTHNLAWQDVYALFRAVGDVEEEPNGNLKVTRRGQRLVLHPCRTKDVETADEVVGLRHFLERSEGSPPDAPHAGAQWLLVIDHHEARIFHAEWPGSTTMQILPSDPEEYFRHEHHAKDFSRGAEKPDPNTFFEPVVQALQAPGPILVFGSGTGMSSEMDQFVAWTKVHHPELATRIVGTVVVDEHHLTRGELVAKAREFFAHQPHRQP